MLINKTYFLIIPFIFSSVGLFLHDPVSLLACIVLTVYILIYLILNPVKRIIPNLTYVYVAVIPMLYLISGFINRQPIRDLIFGAYKRNDGLATVISLFLVFLFATLGKNTFDFINKGLIPLLILCILYGVFQLLSFDFINWNNPYNAIQLTLGNPNQAAALLGLMSISVVYKITSTRELGKKSGFLVLLTVLLVLGTRTNSSQFFLISILGIIVFYSILNIFKIRNLSLIYLVSIFLVLFLSIIGNMSISKLIEITNTDSRFEYMKVGIRIWRDSPIIGGGVDSFKMYSSFHRSVRMVQKEGSFVIPDKSHNLLIDHLANGGLLVALTWLLFIITICIYLFRLIFSFKNNSNELALVSSLWISYLVQTFINPSHILISVIGFMSAGLIVGMYLQTSPNEKSIVFSSKCISYVSKFGLFTLIIFLVISFRVTKIDSESKSFLSTPYRNVSIPSSLLGTWQDPTLTELFAVKLLNQSENCAEVRRISSILLSQNKRSQQAWYFRSLCSSYFGDFQTASKSIDNALVLDPYNIRYLISKFQFQLKLNNQTSARSTLDLIKTINPQEAELSQLEKLLSKTSNS